MKRIISVFLTVFIATMVLTSCGNETAEGDTTIVNPVTEITESEAKKVYPDLFRVPKEAKNVKWSRIMNPNSSAASVKPIIELRFDLDDRTFTAREEKTGDIKKFSHGLNYEWTCSESFDFISRRGRKLSGNSYRYIRENEYVDLSTWYDKTSGMSYSLSVSAESLDGFDLQAIVEDIAP